MEKHFFLFILIEKQFVGETLIWNKTQNEFFERGRAAKCEFLKIKTLQNVYFKKRKSTKILNFEKEKKTK